jgi:hypothetical protein
VRSVMGKPRRFSQAFLQGERAKLHDYRANIRELRNGKVHRVPLPRATRVFPCTALVLQPLCALV